MDEQAKTLQELMNEIDMLSKRYMRMAKNRKDALEIIDSEGASLQEHVTAITYVTGNFMAHDLEELQRNVKSLNNAKSYTEARKACKAIWDRAMYLVKVLVEIMGSTNSIDSALENYPHLTDWNAEEDPF